MKITVGVGTADDTVSPEQARALAAALDIQVKRDLKPIWNVDAEVIALENVNQPPAGVHPIILTHPTKDDLVGQHYIQNGMTYAFVNSQKKNWQLTASHECLEMLVDPSGVTFCASTGIGIVDGVVQDVDGEFQYLLEVCDPLESPSYAYAIDGIPVSDFYTPEYFDRQYKPGVRYSLRGSLTRPRQVLPEGYISWYIPATKRFHQIRDIDGLKQIDVGSWSDASRMSARMFVDANTPTPRSRPDLFGR